MYTKSTFGALKTSKLEICKKLTAIIRNEEIYQNIGSHKINTIINNYISSYNSKGELISSEKLHELRRDFRYLIRVSFGEHAYKIINERPELSFNNVRDFRVFDKKLYDVMGENFVNQLLNMKYEELKFTKENYNFLIDSMLQSNIFLESFKYCYDFVSGKEKELYDYVRAFNTFSKYHSLFVDCYLHKKEITAEQIESIKSVIINPLNELNILKIEDLKEFKEREDLFYAKKMKGKDTVDKYANAILERFFGIYSAYRYADNSFKRSNFSIEVLLNSYNIDRIIVLEENAEKFNHTKILTEEELVTLKLISAVGHIIKHSKTNQKDSISILKNLYESLLEASKAKNASEQILKPIDVRSAILKISNMYKQNLTENLHGIKDFENAVESGEKGIRIEYIKARTSHGERIKIPVYHLEGYKYNVLVTCTQEALTVGRNSGYDDEVPETANKIKIKEYNVEKSQELVRMWFEKENGSAHISCSYDTHFGMGSIETLGLVINDNNQDRNRQATYLIPKTAKIISMGPEDVYSSAKQMDADPSTCVMCTSFRKAFELSAKTFSELYNEIVVDRYSVDIVKRASRIVPEALFKSGKEPSDIIIEHAVAMTEYLIENGLKPQNYVFPIVMVDRSMYKEPRQNELFQYHKLLSAQIDEIKEPTETFDYSKQFINNAIETIDECENLTSMKHVSQENGDGIIISFDD